MCDLQVAFTDVDWSVWNRVDPFVVFPFQYTNFVKSNNHEKKTPKCFVQVSLDLILAFGNHVNESSVFI